MTPFADFQYFAILLVYVAVPTVIFRLFKGGGRFWALLATAGMLIVQYNTPIKILPGKAIKEFYVLIVYAVITMAVIYAFLLSRRGGKKVGIFYVAILLLLAPLAISKFTPLFSGQISIGFVGISYVTFRALDLVICIEDGLIKSVAPLEALLYLFFFPVISSGPIDRYRRFDTDWKTRLGRATLLDDLDAAVHRIFSGFLYKFIISYLIEKYWKDPAEAQGGALGIINYMYAYSFYLFFDFAGYSHFAIGVSRLFGIRTPENFNYPFIAVNIRDFWNRWHMSLSFWFRDHVYMRFLLAANRGKWFKNKHTASYLGFLWLFGLMGLWHGPRWFYLLYGLYHAALMTGHDLFTRWKKSREVKDTDKQPATWLVRLLSIFITFHVVCLGFLIFSGRLATGPVMPAQANAADTTATYEGGLDWVDARGIHGWVWDQDRPDEPLKVDIYDGDRVVASAMADKYRNDLLDVAKGNGAHGLFTALPDVFKDGKTHSVGVKVSGTDFALKQSPQNFTYHGGD